MCRYFQKVKLSDDFQHFSINYFALVNQCLKYFGTFDLKRVDFSWKCFDKLVSVSLISTSAQVLVVKQHLKEVSEIYRLLVLHRYLFKLVDKHDPKGCNIIWFFKVLHLVLKDLDNSTPFVSANNSFFLIKKIKLTNQRAICSKHQNLVALGFKS